MGDQPGGVNIERVSVPVSARVPTGSTNAYLLGDSAAVLVDPAARTPALDAAVDDRTVDHIVATHTHPDHVGALGEYADRLGATVWARRGWTDRFEAATGIAPDGTLGEGTTIEADAAVTVQSLPGHAPDHIGLVVDTAAGNAGVVGDLVFASGSVAVGTSDGDMRAYYTALRRLLAQDHGILYPGHGPPVTSPRDRVSTLLAHRLRREHRIEAAVKDGVDSVSALVDAVYEKDLAGVEALAETTVAAHLEKLDREGRVAWDGTTATPGHAR